MTSENKRRKFDPDHVSREELHAQAGNPSTWRANQQAVQARMRKPRKVGFLLKHEAPGKVARSGKAPTGLTRVLRQPAATRAKKATLKKKGKRSLKQKRRA